MLKRLIIVLIMLPLWCSSQTGEMPDEKQINFDRFWFNTFELPDASRSVSPGIRISGIRVIDARFDTSTIGFMQKGYPDTRRKLKLKNGTTTDIKAFFDSSILDSNTTDSNPGYQIICMIKKLWLSDEIYCTNGSPSAQGAKTVNVETMSGAMLRLEFFTMYDNELSTLYRFDTTIVGKETIFRQGSIYLSSALSGSLKKLSQVTESRILAAKKKWSYTEIEKYNSSRFAIPILDQAPRKGIYMSFEEFKNNQPSIAEYRVDADKITDEIYAKDKNGKEMLLRNVYGFSDGTHIYVGGAGNFFRLHRANKTFNMYGAKSLKRSRQFFTPEKIMTLGLNPETFSNNNTRINYKLKHHPYQLDMETGDFY